MTTKRITTTDLNWWLELEPELDWQFATTYAEGAPHEYVAEGREPRLDRSDFVRAAHVIRTFGQPMKFLRWTRIYLTTPMGWKHWTMDERLGDTTGINRGRVEHVYGVQNAPRTVSGIDSAYDDLATGWGGVHGMTVAERTRTAELIRETFGPKLWRTLDVGCGTGLPIDLGLAEPVRYVGIDPSTAMLNTLVAKHPVTAALHPMRWQQAVQQRVLCGTRFDTVLALGGAASYLDPEGIEQLRARAKRDVLLMHWAAGEEPASVDLDPQRAERSRAAAAALASHSRRIGRFIAAVVPGTGAAAVIDDDAAHL